MKLQITLKNNTAYVNTEDLLASEHTLLLLGDYDLTDAKVILKNGESVTELAYNGNEVALPTLKAGELYITIRAYVHGVHYKTWVVEPILVKGIESDFQAFSEFKELKEKCTSLESRVKELEKSIKETTDYLKDIWNNLEV